MKGPPGEAAELSAVARPCNSLVTARILVRRENTKAATIAGAGGRHVLAQPIRYLALFPERVKMLLPFRTIRHWSALIVGLAWVCCTAGCGEGNPAVAGSPQDRNSAVRAQGPGADTSRGFSAEDYQQKIREVQAKLPNNTFHIVESRPFIVIGDEDADTVKRRAESTVHWAVTKLQDAYFPKQPREILEIWLFKDKASYDKYTKDLFHDTPTTPFGYYSRQHKAMIMNIGTGGGTLVHEIVHPFMEANFPGCPAWFNEGLASLYEQSGERDGKIIGYTNWRLRGLQDAIKAERLISFTTLLHTTTDEFYGENSGTNYAQARYLCYYLQEQGLLREFYQEFHDHVQDDPTGLAALRKVLRTNDLAAFQEKWEAYVLELVFR